MNYWLHRISYLAELSYPLLDKGFLTIGFGEFTSAEIIDKVLDSDWNYFNNQFQDIWGRVPRTKHSLWNFLKMTKGDIIIVPSWGTFYVCKVVDDRPLLIGETFSEGIKFWSDKVVHRKENNLYNEDDQRYDLGFARKVEVLYSISRDKFADAKLTSRMKMRQTNAKINDLELSIKQSIENYNANKPINLHSIIIEKTVSLILETILDQLNPDKFEKLIKTYFETLGADKVEIPSKNERDKEGDADIVAVFENLKLIIYTQAKHHKVQTNEWAINQIKDYKTNKESTDDGYNRIAWVITTADNFSEEAKNIAKENEIQLIDGIEFSKMLLNVGIGILQQEL